MAQRFRNLGLLFIGCLFILVGSASAQLPQTVDVEIAFRVFPVGEAEWKGLMFKSKELGRYKELVFEHFSRSLETYAYKGPQTFVLYRQNGVDEKGQPVYQPVADVQLPVGMKKPMLVFSANPEYKRRGPSEGTWVSEFNIIAVDDSAKGFPIDTIIFLNFTGVPMAGVLGKKEIFLNTGVTGPMEISKYFEKGVQLGLVVKYQDNLLPVHNNTWHFDPGRRHIILILPPKKAGSLRVRLYRLTEYVNENLEFNPNFVPPKAQ